MFSNDEVEQLRQGLLRYRKVRLDGGERLSWKDVSELIAGEPDSKLNAERLRIFVTGVDGNGERVYPTLKPHLLEAISAFLKKNNASVLGFDDAVLKETKR
ncbi:MAG: hypothetical protein DBP00_07285 [gamma proteobacterium symbiont of Ctena orbiculata]|nr:MAG: hypothetical protein DBP00_07285 [gamma proteobacterium symbiont of Ctena orbiculata]